MKNILIILFFSCVLLPPLAGQDESPEDLFAKANRLYQARKYSEAAAAYQQLADREYVSPELYYNLGNAFFKLSRYGMSIYYYEKARRMDPASEDIQFNLDLAQLHVKDRIITPPDFFIYDYAKRFMRLLSASGWAVIALVLLYLVAAEALIRMFVSEGWVSRLAKNLWPVSGALLLCFGMIFSARVYMDFSTKEAVILYSSADIKNEPDAGSPTIFVLHEGSKVEIRSASDDWFEIKLTDGKVGWIKHDELGLL